MAVGRRLRLGALWLGIVVCCGGCCGGVFGELDGGCSANNVGAADVGGERDVAMLPLLALGLRHCVPFSVGCGRMPVVMSLLIGLPGFLVRPIVWWIFVGVIELSTLLPCVPDRVLGARRFRLAALQDLLDFRALR